MLSMLVRALKAFSLFPLLLCFLFVCMRMQRPTREDLEQRHVTAHFAHDLDPTLQHNAVDLEKKLGQRPKDPAELERMRIALGEPV